MENLYSQFELLVESQQANNKNKNKNDKSITSNYNDTISQKFLEKDCKYDLDFNKFKNNLNKALEVKKVKDLPFAEQFALLQRCKLVSKLKREDLNFIAIDLIKQNTIQTKQIQNLIINAD